MSNFCFVALTLSLQCLKRRTSSTMRNPPWSYLLRTKFGCYRCSRFGCCAVVLPLRNTLDVPWGPCQKVTSSTKPEVQNVSQSFRKKTNLRKNAQNLVKFSRVVFEICTRTDRHADTPMTILRTLGEVITLAMMRHCKLWVCVIGCAR